MSEVDYALIVDGVPVPITGRWSLVQPTRDVLEVPTAEMMFGGGLMAHVVAGPAEFTCETTADAAASLRGALERGRPVPFAFLDAAQTVLGYLRVTMVEVGPATGHVTLVRYRPEFP